MANKILKYIDGIPLYINDEEDAKLFKHLNIDALGKTTLPTTSTPFPTMPKGLNYDSPFDDKSVFEKSHWDIERQMRFERELNDLENLLSRIPKTDDFGAGENPKGNPNKNGFAHGDIEKIALTSIYSEQEILEVYYGNWLRDYSQFLVGITVRPDEAATKQLYSKYNLNSQEQKVLTHFLNVFTQDNWVKLLKILATKEFVWKRYYEKRKSDMPYTNGEDYIKDFELKFPPLSKDILGVYRPEEHIDNPKGQKDESKFGYINFGYEFEKGKPKRELKLYKGESAQSLFINAGIHSLPVSHFAKNSFTYNPEGLKYYIFKDIDNDRPSSITYFIQQLRLSIDYGNTNVGRMHLGAALHVLEDYFAHTNFVEVCLIKLVEEDIYPWVHYVDETSTKVDEKKDKKFWQNTNKWVVKNPITGVKNERANCIPIVTGIFLEDDTIASVGPKIADEFFDLSYEPYKARKSGERSLFDILITTLLEAYSKKQSEEKNVKQEFDAKFWLDKYIKYLAFLDFIAKLKDSNFITRFIAKTFGNILNLVTYVSSFFLNLVLNLIFSNSGKAIKETQNLNYGSNPTHTQIAKDPFDHPLNILAGTLAIEAVKDVTLLVRKAIINKKLDVITEKYILEKYFAHPCKTNWMDNIITRWASVNKPELESLKYPTTTAEADYRLKLKKVDKDGFLKYFNKLLNSYKIFFVILVFTLMNTQRLNGQNVVLIDSMPLSKYNSEKNKVSFYYPFNWLEDTINYCEKVFIDTFQENWKTNNHKLLYRPWNLYKGSATISAIVETFSSVGSNIFELEGSRLLSCVRKTNPNGVVYYTIKKFIVGEHSLEIDYTSLIIKDSINLKFYIISLSSNSSNQNKYDKFFDFICNSFSLNEKKILRRKKSKRNSNYFKFS